MNKEHTNMYSNFPTPNHLIGPSTKHMHSLGANIIRNNELLPPIHSMVNIPNRTAMYRERPAYFPPQNSLTTMLPRPATQPNLQMAAMQPAIPVNSMYVRHKIQPQPTQMFPQPFNNENPRGVQFLRRESTGNIGIVRTNNNNNVTNDPIQTGYRVVPMPVVVQGPAPNNLPMYPPYVSSNVVYGAYPAKQPIPEYPPPSNINNNILNIPPKNQFPANGNPNNNNF